MKYIKGDLKMYNVNHKEYPKVVEQLDKLDLSVIKNKTVDQLNRWDQAKLVYALIEDDFDVFLESVLGLQTREDLNDLAMLINPKSRITGETEGAYWHFMSKLFKECHSYLNEIFESFKDAHFEEYPDLRPLGDYEEFHLADRRRAA